MTFGKTFSAALAGLALSASAASAFVIDFTSASTGTTGVLDNGVTWTLSADGGAVNSDQAYDGAGVASTFGDLAFEVDGVGINDDEISNSPNNGAQELILSFSAPVALSGFAFLDLFMDSSRPLGESAIVVFNDVSASVDADSANADNGGFADFMVGGVTDQVVFSVDVTNDGQGLADGALAAVFLAPVPLPAGGLLLLGALGGLGYMRRRQKS